MKKTLMTLAALLTITAAVAQNENQKDNNQQQEQKDKKECCKESKQGHDKSIMLPRNPMTVEQRTELMITKLNLTDEQKAKVKALNEQYKDVLENPGKPIAYVQNGKATTERPQMTDEQKAKVKEQMTKRREYEKNLKDILTANQYDEYKKFTNRPHGRRPSHDRLHNKDGKGPKALKLEQKAQPEA